MNAVGFGLIDTRLIKPMEDADTQIAIGERQVHVGMQAQVREQAAENDSSRQIGHAGGCRERSVFLLLSAVGLCDG